MRAARAERGIDALLLQASDGARLAGLRQQVAFLEAHEAEWQELVGRAEERLSARVIRLAELHTLAQQARALDRKLVEVQGETARLEARLAGAPHELPSSLAERYLARTLELEREGSRLRKHQAWDVRLTAGAIPGRGAPEWYAVAEWTFVPGHFFQNAQEQRYLSARTDELRTARYEAEASLGRLRSEAVAAHEQARRDLEIVEKQLGSIDRLKQVLEASETPEILLARDLLQLEELLLLAERAYLHGLVGGLSRLSEVDATAQAG